MKLPTKRLAVLAMGAALALLMGAPTSAGLGQDDVPLMYDGCLILRLRAGSGGMTAAQRVEEIQIRMQDLMAQQFAHDGKNIVGRISAKKWKKEWTIGTPDCLLLTVTTADARVNNTNAKWLARYWRDRMLQAMIIATKTG